MKNQRVLAVIGLVLIFTSILLMLIGMFAGAAQKLLLSLSLYTFLGAATVLLYLSFKRKQAAEAQEDAKDEE